MAIKNSKFQGKSIKCNLCETVAHGVEGKRHRRCPGDIGPAIRPKHSERLPQRGTWMAG